MKKQKNDIAKVKVKKEVNPKKRALTWNVVDKSVSIVPLLVLGGIQAPEWFSTQSTAISNGVGIALLGGFIALIVSKKAQFLKGCVGFIVVFAICYLLRAILNDLTLISGVACIGAVTSTVWTHPKQVKWEKIRDKQETAEINAQHLGSVIKDIKESEISGRC